MLGFVDGSVVLSIVETSKRKQPNKQTNKHVWSVFVVLLAIIHNRCVECDELDKVSVLVDLVKSYHRAGIIWSQALTSAGTHGV